MVLAEMHYLLVPNFSIRADIQGGIRDIQPHLEQHKEDSILQKLLVDLHPYFERAKHVSKHIDEFVASANE